MVKSYLPSINTPVFPKINYDNIFSRKLVNELHYWIEKNPHVIQPPNLSDSLFFKTNGTLVKKQKHLLQILVRELQNDMILTISQGDCFGARAVDRKVCIGGTYLRNYMPKYIKPMINRNNITCGCETCIIAMLIQSDINKCRLSQLAKIDKLYINSASTGLLKRSNIYFINYNNQLFPNN